MLSTFTDNILVHIKLSKMNMTALFIRRKLGRNVGCFLNYSHQVLFHCCACLSHNPIINDKKQKNNFPSNTSWDEFFTQLSSSSSTKTNCNRVIRDSKCKSRKETPIPDNSSFTPQLSNTPFPPRRDNSLQDLIKLSGPLAAIEKINNIEDLSMYSLDFQNLKLLHQVASKKGFVDIVKKLLKFSSKNFAKKPKKYYSLLPYLATAEFFSGNYHQCIEHLYSLYHLSKDNKKFCSTHATSVKSINSFFKSYFTNELKTSSAHILLKIPDINDENLWNEVSRYNIFIYYCNF